MIGTRELICYGFTFVIFSCLLLSPSYAQPNPNATKLPQNSTNSFLPAVTSNITNLAQKQELISSHIQQHQPNSIQTQHSTLFVSTLNINILVVAILIQSDMSQTKIQELLEDSEHYRSVRLSEATVKRLQGKASRYRDSYESIINRILDEREGKEVNSSERSF